MKEVTFEIHRGDIWKIKGQRKGGGSATYHKPRPHAVCQPEDFCGAPVLLVAPVSSKSRREYPFTQNIVLEEDSIIHYNQIFPVERSAFIDKLGELTNDQKIEMDMRLAVPTGLVRSSILHIKRIEVYDLFFSNSLGEEVYKVRSFMEFYISHLTFTKTQFVEFFLRNGMSVEESLGILRGTMTEIGRFLETLQGLKFLYTLKEDNSEVRKRYAHGK